MSEELAERKEDQTGLATEKLSRLAKKVDKFVMDPDERGDLDGARFEDEADDNEGYVARSAHHGLLLWSEMGTPQVHLLRLWC